MHANRVKVILSWVLTIATAVGSASAGILGMSFSQADFDLGPNSQANSDWGCVDVQWDGVGVQYLNVVVDGSWQIQNAPLYSADGGSRSMSFNFSLGNAVGIDVPSLQYVATIGSGLLSSAPSGTPVAATVASTRVAVGGEGGFWGPVTAAFPWIGWIPTDFYVRTDMPNQEAHQNACAPTAFSNSLRWLDDKNESISIPENLKSVDGLEAIMGWTAAGGTAQGSWALKRDALKDYVTTRGFGPNDLDLVLAELKAGQDVELDGDGHVATLTDMYKLANGMWILSVNHDTDQDNPGGLKHQAVVYDPVTGKLISSAYGLSAGEGIDGFVVECVPEPNALVLLALGLLGLVRREAVTSRVVHRKLNASPMFT